jgi:hypothetical protein
MARHARLVSFSGPLPELPRRLKRLLAVVPARTEGEAVIAAARDLLRERAAGAGPSLDVLVVLDGRDEAAERALSGTGAELLVKEPAGPNKGSVLAFAAHALGPRLDAYDYVLVFDADTRLPDGFLAALRIPSGTEAFQLPVFPEEPRTGAERVSALSAAVARRDDLARDARGLPVRLRGKGMGFTPGAFRAGPAAAYRTTVEDSEATLALLVRDILVRALPGPAAHEEGAGDPAASRARWLAGHVRLVFLEAGTLTRLFAKRPWGTLVLAFDLWLRPRAFVLALDLVLALGATALLALAGRRDPGAFALALFGLAWAALILEARSGARVRRTEDLPRLAVGDFLAAAVVWLRAAARGLRAPGRWHRAR